MRSYTSIPEIQLCFRLYIVSYKNIFAEFFVTYSCHALDVNNSTKKEREREKSEYLVNNINTIILGIYGKLLFLGSNKIYTNID